MINPKNLSGRAENESYHYFDQLVRPLPKKEDGTLDLARAILQHNDIDAFRHAYVSGIFVYEYGQQAAKLAGWLNEKISIQSAPGDENMDFWNNAVGRKLARKYKTQEALAKAIKQALDNGDLITSPNDKRVYEGAELQRSSSSVIVLKESESGTNEIFFDLTKSTIMIRDEFVAAIEAGHYAEFLVKNMGGSQYPVSRSDSSTDNNLG